MTAAERRFRERRRERRAVTADESFFGAFVSTGDPSLPDDPAPGDDDAGARFQSSLDPSGFEPEDSGFMSRQAARVVQSGPAAFERTYRAFLAARAALGVALMLTLGVAGLFGLRPDAVVAVVSVAYAALSITMWLLPRFRKPGTARKLARLGARQWLATIGADLVCFVALHVLAPGSSLNYAALLVLPVLMAGVLTPRLPALATAAGATLALLGTAWLAVLAGGDGTLQMSQAGLAGSGLFVIAVLTGGLATRLAREELTARGGLEMARQQAQLNRLVIEEMQDGVLVVDRRGRVRAANPAARRLLAPGGMSRPAPFQLRGVPAWQALVVTVESAFSEAEWPAAGRDVALQFEAAGPGGTASQRTLRVRVRFTRKREPQSIEEFCVLFLEDVRNMQARSRQEKLAAMGRVSAGIAHEIRNPLSAISQANALLSEDSTDPAQRRLMQMVTDNVERLKRIVDDVMEVAPGAVPDVGVIDATAQIAAVCSEWARTAGVGTGEGGLLRVSLPAEPVGVLFDAEHLRRVLVNLLDNARRHASSAPGAIHLRLDSRRADQAFLSIASDGAPIPPEVEPYLFEPFFSTRSRGTGLGLYICRELCERYGASIDYRQRSVGEALRNEFFVDMRRRSLSPADSRSHPSP
jgi:two-component system, NtrC family, sensor histidine kinase PilS